MQEDTTTEAAIEVEEWRNTGRGRTHVLRIVDGKEIKDPVGAGESFTITKSDRELTSRRNRPKYDPFSNGLFERFVAGGPSPFRRNTMSNSRGEVGGPSPFQLPAGAKERREALEAEIARLDQAEAAGDDAMVGVAGVDDTVDLGERYEVPEGALSADELSDILNTRKIDEFTAKLEPIDNPVTLDRLLDIGRQEGTSEKKLGLIRAKLADVQAKGVRQSGPAARADDGSADPARAAASGLPAPAIPVGGGQFGEADVYAVDPQAVGLGINPSPPTV